LVAKRKEQHRIQGMHERKHKKPAQRVNSANGINEFEYDKVSIIKTGIPKRIPKLLQSHVFHIPNTLQCIVHQQETVPHIVKQNGTKPKQPSYIIHPFRMPKYHFHESGFIPHVLVLVFVA
jgi:hypothetical protein